MRVTLFVAAFAGAAMLASPDVLRSALATSASALFEATPFLLAGIALSRIARGPALAYLGCGCGAGPSARSLPAAAAAWLVFGPAIAVARFIAAVVVARLVVRFARRRFATHCNRPTHDAPQPLHELAAVLPAALIAGATNQLVPIVDVRAMPPLAHVFGGALLGFAMAPCALGVVAVAGALHARAPLAAASFLCIAGIADLRAFAGARSPGAGDHDALAYALLAIALGIVAWRHGDALVHPAIATALAACCVATILLAVRHRREQNPHARLAPAFMLIGALVAAPPPTYHATETTLRDLFPGERLTFTGRLTRDANAAALVRYAITCCRADATPVVVRLAHAPALPSGTWLRVDGAIETRAGDSRLVAQHVERVVPPTDPFIYR